MNKALFLVLAAGASLAACSAHIHLDVLGTTELQEVVLLPSPAKDKVLMIDVSGLISTTVEAGPLAREKDLVTQVYARLERAGRDPSVRAVILRLDTPGGEVTASDIIYHEVLEFKKRTRVPVVGMMMATTASGGYYIAMACDHLLAHPSSLTGSIGVISIFPDVHELLGKVGVRVNVIKSRDLKDAGGPFREMTADERRVFQGIIDDYYGTFLDVVLKGRRGALTKDELRAAADGRVFTARQALELKLIDEVGYFEDAFRKAKALASLREARLVSYTHYPKTRSNIYSMAPGASAALIPSEKTALDAFLAALKSGFYYLWLPEAR
jgi:protease IV